MGNEPSLVRDCKLEKEIRTRSPKSWRLYQSKDRDGSRHSVFVYEVDQQQSAGYIQNAAKYLKVLRHPSILKFYAVENTSDGIWLATEQVTPLENVLEHLSSSEIIAGIYNLLEGLVFLHEKAGVSHNNLSLLSIFVDEEGHWKLGGLEFLCRFDQASASYLSKCRSLRIESSLAPEEKAGKLNSLDVGWARDVYSFGTLMDGLLEYLSDLGELTKTFELRVQDECLNVEPNRRPKLSSFLDDRLFRNDFVQIVNFLTNVTLKSEDEKREFFSEITEKLYHLPAELLSSRLAHPLLSRFVLLDRTACLNVIPHLLTPYRGTRPDYSTSCVNPLLPESLFKKHVIPELFKIFHVRDAHIRMVLLEHFDCYVAMFDKQVLASNILPQILLGLRDSNDDLVRVSLHAIAYLVPLLGGDVVVGAHRLKLFSEATPKFSKMKMSRSVPKSSIVSENGIGKKVSHRVENAGSVSSPSHASSPASGRTLKDLAQDADKERRREEAKKRNEERRKRRQEREKQPQKGKLVTSKVQLKNDDDNDSETHTDNEQADWSSSDWRKQSANEEPGNDTRSHINDNGQTESDIDREIEEELGTMETTVSPKDGPFSHHSNDNSYSSKRADANSTSQPGNSKGALRLKPTKVRTSPPPKPKSESLPVNKSANVVDMDNGDSASDGDWRNDSDTWAKDGEGDSWGETDWDQPVVDKPSTENDVITSGRSSHSHPAKSPTAKTFPSSGGMAIKGKIREQPPKTPPVVKPRVVDTDITKLDIKTSTSNKPKQSIDDDFFADMEPSIKVDGNSLWGMLNTGTDAKDVKVKDSTDVQPKSPAEKKVVSLNFAMADSDQTLVAGGWGDEDLDWGEDDF